MPTIFDNFEIQLMYHSKAFLGPIEQWLGQSWKLGILGPRSASLSNYLCYLSQGLQIFFLHR